MSGPNSANNPENFTGCGCTPADNQQTETNFSSSVHSRWAGIFNGVGLAFVLTVCVTIGRFAGQVDTNVTDIKENKDSVKAIVIEVRELVLALHDANIQQRTSDKRFEEKFDESNRIQHKVLDELKDQREKIIILNQKISLQDDTRVMDLALFTE